MNKKPTKSEQKNDIYIEAINVFGKEKQMNMAIEEMAELIKEISKVIRYDSIEKPNSNIVEEIADVEIMLEQVKDIMSCHAAVYSMKMKKLNRLSERLKELKGDK